MCTWLNPMYLPGNPASPPTYCIVMLSAIQANSCKPVFFKKKRKKKQQKSDLKKQNKKQKKAKKKSV